MTLYFELNNKKLIKRMSEAKIFIQEFEQVNFNTNLHNSFNTIDNLQNVFKDLHKALNYSKAEIEEVIYNENNGSVTKSMLKSYVDFITRFKENYGYKVHLEYFSKDEFTEDYAIVLDTDVNELLKKRVDDYTWLRKEFDLNVISK